MSADPRKPHDLGGLPAGPTDRAEHELAYWEQRIDAMVSLCFRKGVLQDAAELRDGIESLSPDAYEKLSYYERWAASLARRLVDKNILSRQEIDERIETLRAKREKP